MTGWARVAGRGLGGWTAALVLRHRGEPPAEAGPSGRPGASPTVPRALVHGLRLALRLFPLLAATAAHAEPAAPPADAAAAAAVLPFGLDLLPFVGVSSAAPSSPRVVSLNLGAGLSGGTRGLELSAGFGIDRGDLRGAQLAGGFNVVTGRVAGAQLAGGLNVAGGEVNGAQLAGGLNVASGARGAQIAPLNIDAGHTRGVQIGVLNIGQGADGAQIGVVNLASEEVRGAQIGVLNVAPRASAGVGLLNVYWEGFLQVEAFASEDGLILSGVRHGSGALYNVYFVGAQPFGGRIDPAYGLGLGGRGAVSERVELAVDLIGAQILSDGFRTHDSRTRLRGLVAVDLSDQAAVFGGPTLALRFAADGAERLEPLEVWSLASGDVDVTAWPGLTVGVRFL